MTIITALYDGQDIWLGHNDSALVGDTIVNGVLQPWLMFGDWALGITGETAQQDLLSMKVDLLVAIGPDSKDVISAIKEIFTDEGHFSTSEDSASPTYKIWCILVHKDGRMWDVGSHLAITPIPENRLWARGSGSDYALGAAQILATMQLTPQQQISYATNAAISCDQNCPGRAKTIHFNKQIIE